MHNVPTGAGLVSDIAEKLAFRWHLRLVRSDATLLDVKTQGDLALSVLLPDAQQRLAPNATK